MLRVTRTFNKHCTFQEWPCKEIKSVRAYLANVQDDVPRHEDGRFNKLAI